MKYTIIFCLLFILINSKEESKANFYTENTLMMNGYDSNLKKSVCDDGTKDTCKDINTLRENLICCYFENIYDGQTKKERCDMYPNDIDKRIEIYNTKEYKAYSRELLGHNIYTSEEEEDEFPKKVEEIVSCEKGVYTTVYENNFSEKDKKSLKDENHCLNIHEKKESNYKFDVRKCNDYLVLDSSKKAEIECGYFEYNVTLETKTVSIKTCNLFNINLISNMKKLKTIFVKYDFENILESMEIDEEVESFIAEAYDSKGHKIKYDSQTDNMTIENSGYIITALNFLFLLILF